LQKPIWEESLALQFHHGRGGDSSTQQLIQHQSKDVATGCMGSYSVDTSVVKTASMQCALLEHVLISL